tara:strand:+ start:474 stop:767 length:294 start_codon:yes stop_codon:yes gene_type:complete
MLDFILTLLYNENIIMEKLMTIDYKTKGTYTKSARIISDYKNDLVFEQPRVGLMEQKLVSMENLPSGMVKRTTTTRSFTTNGEYNDVESITILNTGI